MRIIKEYAVRLGVKHGSFVGVSHIKNGRSLAYNSKPLTTEVGGSSLKTVEIARLAASSAREYHISITRTYARKYNNEGNRSVISAPHSPCGQGTIYIFAQKTLVIFDPRVPSETPTLPKIFRIKTGIFLDPRIKKFSEPRYFQSQDIFRLTLPKIFRAEIFFKIKTEIFLD